jgi:hypothetical protein
MEAMFSRQLAEYVSADLSSNTWGERVPFRCPHLTYPPHDNIQTRFQLLRTQVHDHTAVHCLDIDRIMKLGLSRPQQNHTSSRDQTDFWDCLLQPAFVIGSMKYSDRCILQIFIMVPLWYISLAREIWGLHGGECSSRGLLGCHAL